ncbi:hypothetical protein EAW55_05365 [Legionella jordanis]|nr:hypothetical protein EAW55_05365 [Legionella jordanis]RMX22150.1 hypothetical protein EAS68_01060 [Legionella jordanis]
MFNFRASNRLFTQSLKFMAKNPLFFMLPLCSLVLSFLLLLLLGFLIRWGAQINIQYLNPPHYYWYFEVVAFLLLTGLIVVVNTLSNAMLVYMAKFKLTGQTISWQQTIRACWRQRYNLISWGIFFTCAGFILSLLERTSGFSRLAATVTQAAWHVCAFLMMPFIVIEQRSPSLAFEKVRDYFTSSAIVQVNVSILLAVYLLPIVILIHLSPNIVPQDYVGIVNHFWLYALLFLFVAWLIVGNSVNAILKTALYLKIQGQHDFSILKQEDINKIMWDKPNSASWRR